MKIGKSQKKNWPQPILWIQSSQACVHRQTLSEAAFSATCTAALLSLGSQVLPSNERFQRNFSVPVFSISWKKDCTSTRDLSSFSAFTQFSESVDKVTGKGDIRTCSTYKRATVGGIRRFIWSLKISQEGHCGCNPHFDYYISSKFQSSIPFKR